MRRSNIDDGGAGTSSDDGGAVSEAESDGDDGRLNVGNRDSAVEPNPSQDVPGSPAGDLAIPGDGSEPPVDECKMPMSEPEVMSPPETAAARIAWRHLETHMRDPDDDAPRTFGHTIGQPRSLLRESSALDDGVEEAKLVLQSWNKGVIAAPGVWGVV